MANFLESRGVWVAALHACTFLSPSASAFSVFPDPDEVSPARLLNTQHNPFHAFPPGTLVTGRLREIRIADCFFNSGLATFYLMRAGLEITAATHSCPTGEDGPCTFDIAGAIGSFADAASFFAEIAGVCPARQGTIQAECADEISSLIAHVADLISGAAGVYTTCNNDEQQYKPDELEQLQHIIHDKFGQRRLRTHGRMRLRNAPGGGAGRHPFQHGEHEVEIGNEPQEIAECVVDTSSASFLLARAGLEITAASVHCVHTADIDEQACAATVSGALGAFAFVASYLSSAAAECSLSMWNEWARLCAADVSQIVASLTELASAGSGTALCSTQLKRNPGGAPLFPFFPNQHNGDAPHGGRRLDAEGVLQSEQLRSGLAGVRDSSGLGTKPLTSQSVIDSQRAILRNVVWAGGRWRPEDVDAFNELLLSAGFGQDMPVFANASEKAFDWSQRAGRLSALAAKWGKIPERD